MLQLPLTRLYTNTGILLGAMLEACHSDWQPGCSGIAILRAAGQ